MTETSPSYDYLFAGFGLAGMSLFYELSKQANFAQKKILIIEPNEKNENDRTWSFWAAKDFEFGHLAVKKWLDGRFIDQSGKVIELKLNEFNYYSIEGLSFYNFIKTKLAECPNVSWRKEKILSVQENGQVQTEKANYSSELVFRSYFQKSDFDPAMSKYFLWQHFYGYLITTPNTVFDDGQFTLMDFSQSDPDLTDFFYVLPINKNKALIEFTEFSQDLYSQEEYQEKLESYIKDALKITEYNIEQVEYNAIPMTDFNLPVFVSPKLINIGSLAGYVKPSTGYAFTRTIDYNKRLARMIATRNFDARQLQSSKTYQAFDAAVLYLIQHKRVHGGMIFASLFRKLGGDFVLRFLDEKCGPWELFKITVASPKKWQFVRFFILKFFRRA